MRRLFLRALVVLLARGPADRVAGQTPPPTTVLQPDGTEPVSVRYPATVPIPPGGRARDMSAW